MIDKNNLGKGEDFEINERNKQEIRNFLQIIQLILKE